MPLIKDLIDIPERVHQGDFVLKLTSGVIEAERTLNDYVVTPQLADAFKNALGFVHQAVQSGSSKAAYLHGSFGSGKSHFMAVLHLLLAGNTQALSIPELSAAVAQLEWTAGRKFLLVPYHMVGARDMESAILGQYAEHVRRLHPEAAVPGFYQAEGLFSDAKKLRAQIGDAAFFGKLGEVAGGDSGWGQLEGTWEAASFESAMREPPHGEARGQLVSALIGTFFSSYRVQAGSAESFVSLDDGLAIMSRHARELGYDAVILFLDELVLWLATHAADVQFVSREGTKLVKLVEATNADRPVPLVSFVARQRDLRELVGENLAGAVSVQFSDVIKHWEARFHRITLEDRNLPAIAEKRVLRPRDEAARQTLRNAFDEVLRLRRDVLDTLLTTDADREMFRRVYPFSPALVQTLIAVSAALQRERTALRLMLQLLVDRRGDLELGQLIPVGDLWDAIAEGDEPFSEGMRIHFDNAKRLYAQRLLPMLETRHGVTWEAIELGQADPALAKNLRNDARLLKTLLLAALVPEVESLKGLTAARLTALNHGTFKAPIPGQEAAQVLRKLREWAGEVGEIRLTEDQNPLVTIQITGVDLEPVLRAAEVNDNLGNRRKKVREMLFAQLGLSDTNSLFVGYEFNWRGTRREVELLYENVREMSDERLKGRSGAWTVVLDFPFDEPNRNWTDDSARLDSYRGGSTRTLVWLPSFLSGKAESNLKRLVILDYILQGERFEQYAGQLSYVDRAQARALAKNQLSSLAGTLKGQLDVAYGISSEPRDAVAQALTADQQFRSLDETLAPRPPVGADFRSAFDDLLGQLFAHQYPAHPVFDADIKPSLVKRIWPEVRNAVESPQHRGLVADASMRRLIRSVINPLRLGQMGETHLIVEPHWQAHFSQQQAREALTTLTVGKLREWMDLPQPMGLPVELQNLIILVFAAQTHRRFVQHGGPFDADIDRLPDELALREEALPLAADWEAAVKRASALFGLVAAQTLNPANVGRLVSDVRRAADAKRGLVAALLAGVRDRARRHAPGEAGAREQTAVSAQAMLIAVLEADESLVVARLAQAPLETSDAAVARAIGQAQAVSDALAGARWDLFDAMRDLHDQREAAARALLANLAEALVRDEIVIPLKAKLVELERDAVRLLTMGAPAATPPSTYIAEAGGTPTVPVTTAQVQTPAAGASQDVMLIEDGQQSRLSAEAAGQLLDQLKGKLAQESDIELSLTWRLERKTTRS